MVWKYNENKIIGVEANIDKNEYELITDDGKVIVIQELIYEDGKLVTNYERIGEIIGEKIGESKGIRWNDGKCYHCGAIIDPYATGCPKCHRTFVD